MKTTATGPSPARLCLPILWLSLIPLLAFGQVPAAVPQDQPAPTYRTDRILVQPKRGYGPAALTALHSQHRAKVLATFPLLGGLQTIAVPPGQTVSKLIGQYRQSSLVKFAEPDYLGHPAATPNDPKYLNGTLWGLNAIEAPGGWDVLTSASNIIVAVIDSGVRYTHQDLAANMWTNTADGGHGLNAVTGSTDPSDDVGHGTMVAGVLGAVGNNGVGVVGVAWRVQIMACKCYAALSPIAVSDVVACLDFARTNHARIINASWGFDTNSLALSNAVSSLRDSGIILVAAAGNSSTNLDTNPVYPACLPLDNVVSVAYTTKDDSLAAPSNYGSTNVHLAAPGDQIYSTFGATDSFYYTMSGSSFAAPYVSGALALLLAKHPAESHQQIISRLLKATDPLPSLADKCLTGGRLNLRKALNPPILLTVISGRPDAFQLRVSADPNRTCILEASPDFDQWTPVFTNTTSPDGAFDFTDTPAEGRRFYRAVSAR